IAGRPAKAKRNGGETKGNGADDWGWLFDNILQGRELHDSIRDLAAKMVTAHPDDDGSDGAIVNQLRGLMEASKAPHDARWQARYDEIPRAVASAREKFGTKQPAPEPDSKPEDNPTPAGRLEAVIAAFNKWLQLKDVTAVYVTLGTVAA